MARILALSDIHNQFEAFAVARLPAADLCLVAGDLTNYGLRGKWKLPKADLQALAADPFALQILRSWQGEGIARAEQWLSELSARYPVLWIPGNHDIGFTCETFANIPGCTCILDRTIVWQGLRIHGVSLAPCYDKPYLAEQWDYMTANEAEERQAFDFEPVDIVVSHSPVYGHCDTAGIALDGADRHIGSKCLLRYVENHAPRLVICGHVHEAQGASRIVTAKGVTEVHNVACTYRLIPYGEDY